MNQDTIELRVSFKKLKYDEVTRKKYLEEIIAASCALLNSNGGTLTLELEDDPTSEDPTSEEVDSVVRMIEQRLLDILGSCAFTRNMTMLPRNKDFNRLEFDVKSSQLLCSLDYKLFIPTQTQVISISPWEHPKRVKEIINREVSDQMVQKFNVVPWNDGKDWMAEDFVKNKHALFTASSCIQVRQLKNNKSKNVSLADQITNKSAKLERYISAFANYNGGLMVYGVTEDNVVTGVVLNKEDEDEITSKVAKTMNKMTWSGGKLDRGKHWNIEFEAVKDESGNMIPLLSVIIISVKPLIGGLFVEPPESYLVVKGKVERMSFCEWMRRFALDVNSMPSMIGRVEWSSASVQETCCQVLQQLLKYQNDGELSKFQTFAEYADKAHKEIVEVPFLVLAESSVCAYKSGQIEKAERFVAEFENFLEFSNSGNLNLLRLRAIHIRSAIARAKGNQEESYEIAQKGLQMAEIAPAGILTAWFYCHVANVEKFLAEQTKNKDINTRNSLIQSAQNHFIQALQHSKASDIEQKFVNIVVDTAQRVHIFRAIAYLGDYANGANFREVTADDIKLAEGDLMNYHHLTIDGYPSSKYRKTYYLLSLSDLRVCQWWKRREQQMKEERDVDGGISSGRLNEALDRAREAKQLSNMFHFEELNNCANSRLAATANIFDELDHSF